MSAHKKHIIGALTLVPLFFISFPFMEMYDKCIMPISVFGLRKVISDKVVLSKQKDSVNYFSNGERRTGNDLFVHGLIRAFVTLMFLVLVWHFELKLIEYLTGFHIDFQDMDRPIPK